MSFTQNVENPKGFLSKNNKNIAQSSLSIPTDFDKHYNDYNNLKTISFIDRVSCQFKLMAKLLPKTDNNYENIDVSNKSVEKIKILKSKINKHFLILEKNFNKLKSIESKDYIVNSVNNLELLKSIIKSTEFKYIESLKSNILKSKNNLKKLKSITGKFVGDNDTKIKEKLDKINLLLESLAYSRKVMENTTMVNNLQL